MKANSKLVFALLAAMLFHTPAAFADEQKDKGTEAAPQEKVEGHAGVLMPDHSSNDPNDIAFRQVKKQVEDYQKVSAKAYEAIKDIGQNLTPARAQHFYLMYQNYNMIGTAKMVRNDVGSAVQSCDKENPDLKPDLDEKFSVWDKAVGEAIKEADANVDNMILAQDYADPKKIHKAFELLDEARKTTAQHIDKKPVTTPEACTYLRDKMEGTQQNLVMLLRRTLISYGSAYPEMPGQEGAQAEKTNDAEKNMQEDKSTPDAAKSDAEKKSD